MYVCLCNGIREAEVKRLARNGATTAASVYKSLGCEPNCATCTEFLQDMIDDVRTAAGSAKTPLSAGLPAGQSSSVSI